MLSKFLSLICKVYAFALSAFLSEIDEKFKEPLDNLEKTVLFLMGDEKLIKTIKEFMSNPAIKSAGIQLFLAIKQLENAGNNTNEAFSKTVNFIFEKEENNFKKVQTSCKARSPPRLPCHT